MTAWGGGGLLLFKFEIYVGIILCHHSRLNNIDCVILQQGGVECSFETLGNRIRTGGVRYSYGFAGF
jgi:hypothetical protein